jgi:hypothetical protein
MLLLIYNVTVVTHFFAIVKSHTSIIKQGSVMWGPILWAVVHGGATEAMKPRNKQNKYGRPP